MPKEDTATKLTKTFVVEGELTKQICDQKAANDMSRGWTYDFEAVKASGKPAGKKGKEYTMVLTKKGSK